MSNTCEHPKRMCSTSLEDVLAALKSHDWAAKIGILTIFALLLWKVMCTCND